VDRVASTKLFARHTRAITVSKLPVLRRGSVCNKVSPIAIFSNKTLLVDNANAKTKGTGDGSPVLFRAKRFAFDIYDRIAHALIELVL
jgi:hypothetical protein